MTTCQMKSSLSKTQSRLVSEMQRLDYGDIYELHVRNGKPIFEPMPKSKRKVNLEAMCNKPKPISTDFALKALVLLLFEEMAIVGNGIISVIKIADGLPVRVEWDENSFH